MSKNSMLPEDRPKGAEKESALAQIDVEKS